MQHLTRAQRDTLRFVIDFWQTEAMSPTYKEIAAHHGISKVSAYERVNALIRKGWLKKRKKLNTRTLYVPDGITLEPEKACPVCGNTHKTKGNQ